MRLDRHPKGLWILAFGNLWDTFSYYGTQTVLALYLIHVFHFSLSDSYLVYGGYAALAYFTPILGGIIADRWLGSRNAMLYGYLLNIIGNFILMSNTLLLFSVGLATSLIGSGLYKSTSTHVVGVLYHTREQHQETGFTILYLALNVGGAAAPLVYGLMIYHFGWNYGFLSSALGITLSLIFFLSTWKLWPQQEQTRLPLRYLSFIYVLIVLTCGLLSFAFYHLNFLTFLPIAIFIMGLGYLLIMIFKYQQAIRKPLLMLLLLNFFAMFYFAAAMQIGTTITSFIQAMITQKFIHLVLPASIFSTFYALFVLLLAPFFTWFWYWLKHKNIKIMTAHKIGMSLTFATLGIYSFAFAASTTHWILSSIILGNLFLSAGELVLTPAMLTAISNNAPQGIRGVMMGSWFLFVGLGSYFSALLAKFSHAFAHHFFMSNTSAINMPAYFAEFIFIGTFTAVIAVLVLIASQYMKHDSK
jgi:POT family proton-dependent oligopeptide transporter